MTEEKRGRTEVLEMLHSGELDAEEADRLLELVEEDEGHGKPDAGNRLDAFPAACPSCGSALAITRASCTRCSVKVDGNFAPCPFCMLDREQRRLLRLFLTSRGKLREMGRRLGLSYPTVKSRLDELLAALGLLAPEEMPAMSIIKALRAGRIDVEEACRLLEDKGARRRTGPSRSCRAQGRKLRRNRH